MFSKFLTVLVLVVTTSVARVCAQYHIIPSPQKMDILSQRMFNPSVVALTVDTLAQIPSEGYHLRVLSDCIEVTASDSIGLLWGQQTIRQLATVNGFPDVEIFDYPAHPFRAFMHDTGRNFIEIEMLKQHIDLMSAYKINVFHWHLTDNPAWRIECKVYPQLNDAKYQRVGRDQGRFYTYDQIRDVIAYAKERGVMVVPEIDMPGHSQFFSNTFGFTMDSKQGMAVLEKCLAEFFNEIPVSLCPYFHIGSDEVHIPDPQGFMQWSENFVAQNGRIAIAWDPGLPSSATTIRQIWNEASGANNAAAKKQGSYLDSFMGYLNYYDPIIFTSRLFLHTPCGVDKPNKNAMGGILCLWNDVNVDDKSRIELHNGMANGLLTFSERFWKGGQVADTNEAKNLNIRPNPASEAGKKMAQFESKLAFHRDNYLKKYNMRWVANSTIPFRVVLGGQEIDVWGGAIDVSELQTLYNIEEREVMDAVAYTGITATCDTVITAWVGFEAPARSNRLSAGIGQQGKWENGGQIWVNNMEILPPEQWNEPGEYAFHFNTWHKPEEELPYTDEQFYWMRRPVRIPLMRGVNTIKLTFPKTFSGQRWSFAFIPITTNSDGTVSEATGIRFEPQSTLWKTSRIFIL